MANNSEEGTNVQPNPFKPLEKDQLEGIKQALEQDPIIVEGAAKAPEYVQNHLEEAKPEFLEGYLAGVLSAINTVSASNQAAQQNDMNKAQAFNNRMNTVNYMICKILLEGQSRIITTPERLH